MTVLFFILAALLIFIALFVPRIPPSPGECHRCGRFVKPPFKQCSDCIPKKKESSGNG